MRIRKKAWSIKEFESSEFFIKDLELQNIFKNDNPINIEIGCGKGQFIIENSIKNPNINYLGIEREEKILCLALKSIREKIDNNFGNIYFFNADASNLDRYFKDFENKIIERIYINFCDPWRNRVKWHKRRLTHRNFLKKYQEIMPNGEIHFKTDDRDLFNFSINEFKVQNWELIDINYDLHKNKNDYIKTEYEEKFIKLEKPIHRLVAIIKT